MDMRGWVMPRSSARAGACCQPALRNLLRECFAGLVGELGAEGLEQGLVAGVLRDLLDAWLAGAVLQALAGHDGVGFGASRAAGVIAVAFSDTERAFGGVA